MLETRTKAEFVGVPVIASDCGREAESVGQLPLGDGGRDLRMGSVGRADGGRSGGGPGGAGEVGWDRAAELWGACRVEGGRSRNVFRRCLGAGVLLGTEVGIRVRILGYGGPLEVVSDEGRVHVEGWEVVHADEFSLVDVTVVGEEREVGFFILLVHIVRGVICLVVENGRHNYLLLGWCFAGGRGCAGEAAQAKQYRAQVSNQILAAAPQ